VPYGAQDPQYAQAYAGQVAGRPVVIPSGVVLQVRINQPLSSNHSEPGNVFDGVVTNDVFADGAIAIPRGAAVQGRVVDAQKSGALKGRGEMSIQLTSLMLGGKVYPIVSDIWAHSGSDKTVQTVNSTLGVGALGAIIGAVAGGGVGAAIGGGVGAAAGLGASAASGGGQIFLPPEALVTFHLVQPAPVATVSQQEMQRLAYGVPSPGGPPPYMRRRVVYPGPYGYPPPYPGPVYYRGPGPYPYY
jgi:hypothetical protein